MEEKKIQELIDVLNKHGKRKVTKDSIESIEEENGKIFIRFNTDRMQPVVDMDEYQNLLDDISSLGYKKPIRTCWARVGSYLGYNKHIWWIELTPKKKLKEGWESESFEDVLEDTDDYDLFLSLPEESKKKVLLLKDKWEKKREEVLRLKKELKDKYNRSDFFYGELEINNRQNEISKEEWKDYNNMWDKYLELSSLANSIEDEVEKATSDREDYSGELGNKEIEKFVEKTLDKYTDEDILDLIPQNSFNDDIYNIAGPCFVLEDGRVIDVNQALDRVDAIHQDLMYELMDNLLKKEIGEGNYEANPIDIRDATYNTMEYLTFQKGWMRVNPGFTAAENRFYCVLPNKMTYDQYDKLLDFIYAQYDPRKGSLQIFATDYADYKEYMFNENTPEEIIGKIKRYYSSGRFVESLNESKADIEKFRQWAGDELADRFFKQKDRLQGKEKDIYYWMGFKQTGPLKMALRDIEKVPTKKETDEKAKDGIVRVYEDDEWLVLHILNYEASKKYGKGTKWCISGENGDDGRESFDSYTNTGDIYFFINKKNKSKYALSIDGDYWTLYNDSDWAEVGSWMKYGVYDSWDPNESSKPHFPTVKGLPDINAEYDRAEREIKSMEEGLKEAQLLKTKTVNYKDYWGNDKSYQSQEYKPRQDSKYKRLIKKPINTLTLDEITYIYLIHEAWYMQNVEWFDNTDNPKLNSWVRDKKKELEECYKWLHSLSFPLTVYRGIRVGNYKSSELNTDTDELNISGRQHSHSWTTDINIYKNDKSKFRGLTDIYACEIDSDIVDVANTIDNFIHYSSERHKQGYPEYEITLKDHFKMSDLHNLRKINKEEVESLSEELDPNETDAFVDKYFTEENLKKVLPSLEAKPGFFGKCFIDKDGKVYDVQKLANAHDSFLMDVFDECYRNTEGKYPDWEELIGDGLDDLGAFIVDAIWDKLYDMNWIQCSNEIGGYIALRNRPTEEQYQALEEWLFNLYEHGYTSAEISLYVGDMWGSKRYSFRDYAPDQIIKKTRRAYGTGKLTESIKKLELDFDKGYEDGVVFYTANAKEALDKMKSLDFTRFVYFPNEGMYVISDDYIHTDLQDISLSELGCDSSQMVYDFIFSTGNYLEGEMEEDEGDIYTYKDFEIFDRYEGFKETSLYEYLGEPLNKRHIKHTYWESLKEDYGYHAGDLGKSEYYGRQSGGRNTGHFGTGTYFVGNPEKIKNYNDRGGESAPQHKVDFSKYHLYKPSNNDIAYDLHDTLGLLDGVYTWYLPILKEITNVVSQAEKYIYDGQPIQNLSEFIDDLNKCEEYYDAEPIDKEKALRYLDEEEFDKYLDEIDPDEWDNAWEEKYALEKVFKEKLKDYKNWRISTDVNKINNIVEELYKALEGKHTKEEIQNALDKVVEVSKEYKTRNADKEDSLATVFMKSLGYEGVDTRHLNKDMNGTAGLDNTSYGSVIYDLKPDTIVECLDEELLSTEEFDMFVAESPYQAKNYLLGQVEAQRIFADETSSTLYLISPTYETIHSDMTAFARECGYNTKMDDFDKKKACLIFVPDTDDFFDEEGDAFDDDYDYKYVFNGGQFVIYSRYQDFSNFELCKAFGNDYEEYYRVNEDSDAYREGILFEKISPKFNLQSFLKERLENYKVEGNKTITTKISR